MSREDTKLKVHERWKFFQFPRGNSLIVALFFNPFEYYEPAGFQHNLKRYGRLLLITLMGCEKENPSLTPRTIPDEIWVIEHYSVNGIYSTSTTQTTARKGFVFGFRPSLAEEPLSFYEFTEPDTLNEFLSGGFWAYRIIAKGSLTIVMEYYHKKDLITPFFREATEWHVDTLRSERLVLSR